jgi:hypothetical protein
MKMRELLSECGRLSGGVSGEHARRLNVGIALVLLMGMCGCVNSGSHSASTQTPSAPIQTTDACASRLHDICGLLLMYSLNHPDLPASLDELRSEPGFDEVKEFVCPVSHKPYVYNPGGLPYENGFLVMYDATPAHSGMRWAILITRPTGTQPLETKVIAVKESFFARSKK